MAEYLAENIRKVTACRLKEMKQQGEKIAMLTSYDFTMAGIVDGAGIDVILVGDSASNVMAGNTTTLPITVDEMVVYARSVVRAVKRAFVVCDMPFGSYQVTDDEGVRNAVRIVKETGCDGVKIEGGEEIAPMVRRIVSAGIPVVGHLGLTPQSVNIFGGYGVRAKAEAEAEKLLSDAHALEQAGCCAVTLEKVPAALATRVSKELAVPTIGIGAGNGCDGQVLVVHDMLGMNKAFKPKFLRHYAQLHDTITEAVSHYVEDVKSGAFPSESESY